MIFAWLRQAVLGDRATFAEQFAACRRLLLATLGGAGFLAVLGVVAAARGGGGLLVAVVVLELLVVAAAVVAGWFTVEVVQQRGVLPLQELAGSGRRLAGGDLAAPVTPYGPVEFQQIAAGVGSLAAAVARERQSRDAVRSEGEHQATALRQILRLTQEISNSLDLERIAERLGGGAMHLGGWQEGHVWLHDEGQQRLRPVWSSVEGPAAARRAVALADSELARAITGAQTLTLRGDGAAGQGLAVPLTMGLSVLGVVELRTPAAAGPMVADALEAIETLASHAATAIAASRLHQEVELRSETDGLTRVFNRRKLENDLRAEVVRCVRYARPLALIMVDVDHFKSINDEFGHQQGDEVLKLVAAIVGRGSRETDSAYRYGGEEFTVLLRETEAAAAAEIADRLRLRITAETASLGLPRPITASLGVAALGASVQSADALVEAADKALYAAKEGGRNRVVRAGEG